MEAEKVLDATEALLQAGLVRRARLELKQVRISRLSRPLRTRFAYLARRAEAPLMSLRALRSVIYARGRQTAPATALEKTEYAASLVDLGALNEGLRLLDTFDPVEAPRSMLIRISAQFKNWEYSRAVPVLETYLRLRISEYDQLIGRVNLAAALISIGELQSASRVAALARKSARMQGARRLEGNCHELEAQIAFQQRRFKECDRGLDHAERLLKEAGTVDALYVEKWRAVSALARDPHSRRAMMKLQAVRRAAIEKGNWETVRDCDFHRAILLQNLPLLEHVYHGSPFDEYRMKIRKAAPPGWSPESGYVWALDPPASVVFDLGSGANVRGAQILKPTSLPLQILRVVSRDFYRSLPVAALFGSLFPGEYFNPESSPHRVHQLVTRLNADLRRKKIRISVRSEGAAYRLTAEGGTGLRTSLRPWPATAGEVLFERISAHAMLARRVFSISDVMREWRLSRSSALRALGEAVGQGLLEKTGAGPATRYQVLRRRPVPARG